MAGPAQAQATPADRALATAICIAALVLYLCSAPRSVMLDDDGYFLLAAWSNGVAHPPGFPLYTQLAHLATWLPFGSIAWRVHAFSGLCGALACACLFLLLRRFGLSRPAATGGALAFAFSSTFWSQAIIAEVYALNVLLLLVLFLLAFGPWRPRLTAFVYGLSLSNHWPLMLLTTPALLVAAWPHRARAFERLPLTLLCLGAGLMPYLLMVLRSRMAEISFYGPIETLDEFWFYLSREGYRQVDSVAGADWNDRLAFAGFLLREALHQFGVTGAALTLFGFWCQWHAWPRYRSIALLFAALGSTLLLLVLLGFSYDLRYQNVLRVYPLPAYVACAAWLALGLHQFGARLQQWAGLRVRSWLPGWGLAAALVASVLVGSLPQNWRAQDDWAENYARSVLRNLPSHARLFVFGDYASGPIGYLHLVEGVRRDVELFHSLGLIFETRLFRAYSPLLSDARAAIDALIADTSRPVFYITQLDHRHDEVDYGLFRQVLPGRRKDVMQVTLSPPVLRYFERVFHGAEPADLSQLLHYRQLTSAYCGMLANFLANSAHRRNALNIAMEARCENFYGLLARAGAELSASPPAAATALELLARADRHLAESVTIESQASLYLLRASALLEQGDTAAARAALLESIAMWPGWDNPAHAQLGRLQPAGH